MYLQDSNVLLLMFLSLILFIWTITN